MQPTTQAPSILSVFAQPLKALFFHKFGKGSASTRTPRLLLRNSILRVIILLALLLGLTPAAPVKAYGPVTWYVRPMGSDAVVGDVCSGKSDLDVSNHPNCAKATIEGALAVAADGDIIMAGNSSISYYMSIDSAIVVNKGVHLILAPEFWFVQTIANTPCFIISANYVRITGGNNAATCQSSVGSQAIQVQDGVHDLTISGMNLIGKGNDAGEGIHFAGAIQNVQILNNTFTNYLGGYDLFFTALPTGIVDIQGNQFNTTSFGAVRFPAKNSISLQYNSWETNSGPYPFTDIPAMNTNLGTAAYTPFTYAGIKFTFDSPHEETGSALNGETVILTVSVDAVNLTGVDFSLVFPNGILSYESGSTTGTLFSTDMAIDSNKTTINSTGRIKFHGAPTGYATLTNTNALIYTITFTAIGSSQSGGLYLDGSSDSLSMDAGQGPSNTILPDMVYKSIYIYPSIRTVTGTISMQGRVPRDGASVTLTGGNTKTGTTIDKISENFTIADVKLDSAVKITVTRSGYLKLLSANNKTLDTRTYNAFKALELKGGNANTDDVINVSDAGLIGADYGTGGHVLDTDFTDINSSGRVDIYDLALMGGNYDMTSLTAYGDGNNSLWIP